MSKKELRERRREIEEGDITCPLLDKRGLCMVYEARPFVCRLWGNTKSLMCPNREYDEDEEGKLLDDDLRIFQRYRRSAKVYNLVKLVR